MATFDKLVRFAIVGASATLAYAVFAVLFEHAAGLDPLLGHLLAFWLAIPLSFVGQCYFAFRYQGRKLPAFGRFAFTAVGAFLISTGVSYYTNDVLEMPYYVGVGITVVIIPLFSFVVYLFWVFAEAR